MADQPVKQLQQLISMMAQLRHPDTGCSWDKQQNFHTIAAFTLEETWEVLDAISREDKQDLRDELGDLLFQILFYARLGEEESSFDFNDICQSLHDKLIRRHPQVFGVEPVRPTENPQQGWQQIKQQERAINHSAGLLRGIPEMFPALLRAEKIQLRCQAVGFDWDNIEQVLAKVHEEIEEVMQEARMSQVDPLRLEEEIGDLLFATVNLARHLGQNAERALGKANNKFIGRFQQVERRLAEQQLSPEQATLEQMEQAWQWVKQTEKTPSGYHQGQKHRLS